VTSAIVGATSVAQLDENVAALERPISDEEHKAAAEAAHGTVQGPPMGPRNH
jgi:aryl-alcohol dehydrogenase-like predicted oxidoreductase